jgi:GntR family transcriptional regulator
MSHLSNLGDQVLEGRCIRNGLLDDRSHGTSQPPMILGYDSSMLQVNLDRSAPTTLHDQVAAEIRRAIAEGEVQPGDRLPPAVDFATVLGVNKNTVIRAMRMLRDEGILDFTRGRGVRVVGTQERSAVLTRLVETLSFARDFGYHPDDVISMIKSIS